MIENAPQDGADPHHAVNETQQPALRHFMQGKNKLRTQTQSDKAIAYGRKRSSWRIGGPRARMFCPISHMSASFPR
jgi:hypothetical protein